MPGGNLLDRLTMTLRNIDTGELLPVYIDVFDNSLSRKWLGSLNHLLAKDFHLEKNYCFIGFEKTSRDGKFILSQINRSIRCINASDIGYHINDIFTIENTITSGPIGDGLPGGFLIKDKMNNLHRYFEDLQGVSGAISPFAKSADPVIKWHIRQLNLLCHEFESWALTFHKSKYIPQWIRPSQLMCWLSAPRFVLEPEDYELFGIDTINRSLGGVFVGVNKAVGKHHFEVFCDEGRDSRIGELTTSTLKSQTEAAGDFDIEWANDPGAFEFQKKLLKEFREWLVKNNFDPEDKSLTIGHPKVGQVDLSSSFGSENFTEIWKQLNTNLDVYSLETSDARAVYDYHWSDVDFVDRQVKIISRNEK